MRTSADLSSYVTRLTLARPATSRYSYAMFESFQSVARSRTDHKSLGLLLTKLSGTTLGRIRCSITIPSLMSTGRASRPIPTFSKPPTPVTNVGIPSRALDCATVPSANRTAATVAVTVSVTIAAKSTALAAVSAMKRCATKGPFVTTTSPLYFPPQRNGCGNIFLKYLGVVVWEMHLQRLAFQEQAVDEHFDCSSGASQ